MTINSKIPPMTNTDPLFTVVLENSIQLPREANCRFDVSPIMREDNTVEPRKLQVKVYATPPEVAHGWINADGSIDLQCSCGHKGKFDGLTYSCQCGKKYAVSQMVKMVSI